MNDKKPEVIEEVTESKPSFRDRLRRSATNLDPSSKPKTTFGQKAKNVAAVVGVVAVAGAVAAAVSKKKSASVDLTLPDLDVTLKDA